MAQTREPMSRRQWLAAGAALAGYALAASPTLAQAVRTDEAGLAVGQFEVTVGDAVVPVYEARPAAAAAAPIVLLVPEIWRLHEDMKKFVDLAWAAGNPNVEMVVYPNAGHAFHADYQPSYAPAAAAAAWEQCLQFFARHLRA